jgi:tetratricopeptide (TPR) repeat protein
VIGPVPAQATQPVQASPVVISGRTGTATADDLLRAEILINHGQDAEAKGILLELEKQASGDRARKNQVQFLLGLLDMQDQDYESAISRFRRILVFDPTALRVRLEMGRTFFMMGRYGDAERQFLYARAGKLPKTVLANVDRYLGAIRQRKTFSYGAAVAIAPDSNLNAGPATDTISLYGLPFQLSPNAKANSGVGLTVDANAEWAPRIGKRTKWRVGTQLHRAQYLQTAFDDMALALYSGPQINLKRWDLSLLGNVSRRWYGDRGYATAFGPSVDANYFLNPHLGVGLSVNVRQIDYDLNSLQNGLGKSVGLNFFDTPTAASFVRGAITIGRQDARVSAYAFDSRQFGLDYVREFAGGLTVGISPTFTAIDYKAPLAAFAVARRDQQYVIQLSLLDRRIDFHGITPRIVYTFIKNKSNIDLFRFKRNRVEIGFTSSF